MSGYGCPDISAEGVNDLILGLDEGTPNSDDLLMFVEYTPAVSRVMVGSCSAAGTEDSTLQVGSVIGLVIAGITSSANIDQGADDVGFATEIALWLNTDTNLADIGATSAVVGDAPADNTVRITFPAGANSIAFSEDDPNFSWTEETAGADAVYTLKKTTKSALARMDFVGVEADLEINNANHATYEGKTLRLLGAWTVSFDSDLPDGFVCQIKNTTGSDQEITANAFATTPDSWNGVAANGIVTVYNYNNEVEIIGQGAVI